MAEPGLSELVTTTQKDRQEILRDDITNNNAVLKSMKENDAMEMEDGGTTILEEMWYAENATFLRYSGGQILNTAYNPTMTSAEFEWKQFAGSVVITGLDARINSGPNAVIKLLKGRIKALEYTLQNNYNADILSDGTADSGKQIGGLKLIVAKIPTTGTVGGIDRSTTAGAFYRNFKFDTVNDTTSGAPGGVATTAANIKTYLNYCLNNTTRNQDRVKMLLMGQTHYAALQGATQAIQRIMDVRTANIGYPEMEYMGIPCYLGGGVNFGGETLVQADLTYGLNTAFLKMRTHKDANMEPLPKVQSINQDAEVAITVWMGNMTCSAPKLQFVMFDS